MINPKDLSDGEIVALMRSSAGGIVFQVSDRNEMGRLERLYAQVHQGVRKTYQIQK